MIILDTASSQPQIDSRPKHRPVAKHRVSSTCRCELVASQELFATDTIRFWTSLAMQILEGIKAVGQKAILAIECHIAIMRRSVMKTEQVMSGIRPWSQSSVSHTHRVTRALPPENYTPYTPELTRLHVAHASTHKSYDPSHV